MEVRHYFAYGANMSRAVFCGRRGMRPLASEPAFLPDHEVCFEQRGIAFVEPAFASIRPAPSRAVHGVLYAMTPRDLGALDHMEAAYGHVEVDVVGRRSGTVRARAYRAKSAAAGLLPSRRYLRVLCEGAREAELPAEYVAWLEAHPAHHVPFASAAVGALIASIEALMRRGFRPLRLLDPLWRIKRRR